MTDTIAPGRTALLVMDYQPGIVERLPDPDAQLDLAARAIALARAKGAEVGYVRVAFTDADFDDVPETSRMGAMVAQGGRAFHADEPATQVHERVAPQDGDIVVRKKRVGAFSTTDLDEQLKARGVDTIVLAGISTSGVVLSTVRDGYDRDYRVVVLSDGSADSGHRRPRVPDHGDLPAPGRRHHDRRAGGPARLNYKWVALSNTTMAVFMSALDGSIVIIALPAIFRGIHLDPLAPGNIGYLLWMIMGYRLVQAVLVVNLGRFGDMFGRVRLYNAGFAVFTFASILLSFDPFQGGAGAMWLIGWRVLQAIGGSMLTANSAAILTDAFASDERGFALGINQVAALAGQFVGLVAGGLLAAIDWRAVFWVNVPVGVFGTVWAYLMLRDSGDRQPGRIDWWGNVTFAVGLGAILTAVTQGLHPYARPRDGLDEPDGARRAGRRLRAARRVRRRSRAACATRCSSSACSGSASSPPATSRASSRRPRAAGCSSS